jgi:excisionase family DNA binding protein
MDGDKSLRLTTKEIASAFSDPLWAQRFPPLMTVEQAADLLQVPKATVYDWRSRGLLKKCSRKVGRYVRFWRDSLIILVLNEGLHCNEK